MVSREFLILILVAISLMARVEGLGSMYKVRLHWSFCDCLLDREVSVGREMLVWCLMFSVVPTMVRQGANSAIRFTAFDAMQSLWTVKSSANAFMSGAVAGTAATCLNLHFFNPHVQCSAHDAI